MKTSTPTTLVSPATAERILGLFLASAFLLLFAGSASAQETPEAIFACVQPGSGILYVVDEAGDCKAPSHKPLQWSIVDADDGDDSGGEAGVGDSEPATAEVVTLALENGWQEYGDAYGAPTAARQGDLVILEGLVQAGTSGAASYLPAGWEPGKRLVFETASSNGGARVDVLTDGEVRVNSTDTWVSLAGVAFMVGGE